MSLNFSCKRFEAFNASPFMLPGLMLQTILAAIAIPFTVLAIKDIWCSCPAVLMPLNTRIIIQFHLFGDLLHCISRLSTTSICNLNTSFFGYHSLLLKNIAYFDVLSNLGMWLTMFTIVPLLIERIFATIHGKRYANYTGIFTVWLIALHFFLATIPLYLFALAVDHEMPPDVFVYIKFSAPHSLNIGPTTLIFLQLLGIIFFFLLKTYTKSVQRPPTEYCVKFYVAQNYFTTTVLSSICNFAFFYHLLHFIIINELLIFEHIESSPYLEYVNEMISATPALSIVLNIYSRYTLNKNCVYSNSEGFAGEA
ncbi:unnamed protein product [Caenorhabditis bovis]|uniref:Uncharacterized protein n=1 Tax=Caenorhabditis bovis TaxID=2654633 RepID=A0A8S1EAG2_9PELO|nr:unnamed protein product [Caenorhabditis bovis]